MRIALPFYVYMMFVPLRKHMYGPLRPVTRIALPFYVYMMFVPHRKHMYGPPRPFTGIALLYVTCILVMQIYLDVVLVYYLCP
jgi:hypothetical protein